MAPQKKVKREDVIRAALLDAGYEPNERQLVWAFAFCKPGRTYRDSTAAAEVAGYPDPERGGDNNFSDFGHVLDKVILDEATGPLFVYQNLIELTRAVAKKPVVDKGVVLDMLDVPDNSARLGANKALMEFHGMAAPTKSEVTLSHKDIAKQLAEAQARGDGYGE